MNNVENDSKIITLKKQIAEKRAKLEGIKNFSPVTNCSIEFEDTRYNIRVLTKEQVISLMIKLNINRMSARDVGLLDDVIISGYKVEDWIADFKARLEDIKRKDEEKKLVAMESKLDRLLSDEKRTSLELEDIENLLK